MYADPLPAGDQAAMARALAVSLPALRQLTLTYPRLCDDALEPLAGLSGLTRLEATELQEVG